MNTRAYRNELFQQLTSELIASTPAGERLACTQRAERLLAEVDAAKVYPFSFFTAGVACGSSLAPQAAVSGSDARHDLRLLIEDVSDSAHVSAEAAGERVLTLDELSQQLRVSTKTITRWREHGLVGRRFVFDGHKRLGFLQSSVDHFVRHNEQRIGGGARFRPMSDNERAAIIEQARRLVATSERSADVVQRLVRESGRSAETIRHTLQRHDELHPTHRILAADDSRSDENAAKLYQQYRRGVSLDVLAQRFGQTRAQVERTIQRVRFEQVQKLPLEHMPSPDFAREDAEQKILVPMPAAPANARKPRRPEGLPSYLASLYEVPLLTTEQERHLFRKYNYVKFRAAQLREQVNAARPQSRLLDEIERLYAIAVETKNQIIQANLRLVVSISKKHVSTQYELFDLVSDGNVSLMRAVEKFDVRFGFKFSTYATWAIRNNFARTFQLQARQQEHFQTSRDELLASQAEQRSNVFEQESAQSQRVSQIKRILERLNERERRIIARRFGLAAGQEPQTLQNIGEELGVSKERIRQIETVAMNKLRAAVREQKIECPASWN